jgi:hypothetical protein
MLTIMALLLACGTAQAGILWTWTNAGTGTEQGTFLTDGELVSGEAPAGSYTLVDFTVTASVYPLPIGSVSGGEYSIGQPSAGFLWDGAAPTQFWRSSGIFTNGFALDCVDPAPGDPTRVAFGIEWFTVDEYYGVVYLNESATVVMAPSMSVAPNEAATFGAVKRLFR